MSTGFDTINADEEARCSLEQALRKSIGDVRFDRLARTIYATDGSIYQITPAGVVCPQTADEVIATVRACRACAVPIVARGAGTGLTGGAVGSGVVLDLSRHMNRIISIDPKARTAVVEPGVVLDDLNAALKPAGLLFAPDVATSSRATIGGMIANNSCGARSVRYGRTVDHVARVDIVTADGRLLSFGHNSAHDSAARKAQQAMAESLGRIRDEYHDEIERRFPKVLRSNGGYGLDRLGPPGTAIDPTKVICGSEGTLGIVVRATLKLTPLPKHTLIVVLQFRDLLESLRVTPNILAHQPSAVELIDDMIIDAARSNPVVYSRCDFIKQRPQAMLAVEFIGDDSAALHECATRLRADRDASGNSYAQEILHERSQQSALWQLRHAGLGLLMSKPGDKQPYAFVEDSAVDPSRLRDYIERFASILDAEQVTAGYYAHASVGCLHVRPVLNLKSGVDVHKMQRIAESIADLALEFGGAMTGEHGDGLLRSCWAERMYGPRIIEAFREVKQLFDPDHLLNPHKIIDPWPMTEHLRQGPTLEVHTPRTALDFSAHGGMAGLASMCTGVGQCRQRNDGTMCPSYMATGDETHTTRARANALRVALSNRGLLDGLHDVALDEVLDLCLSCKACKTECPTGVDMARLKAEWQFHRVLRDGSTPMQRMIANMPRVARLGSHLPRITNFVSRTAIARQWTERRAGLDHRIPPPRWANRSFRSWWRRRNRAHKSHDASPADRVALFVDTWTDAYAPNAGIAAVRVLEAAGYDVSCVHSACCARPAISKGLLAQARATLETSVESLMPFARDGVPIVGIEPSCILTFQDEAPQLVRNGSAMMVAAHAQTIESFLAARLDSADPIMRIATPPGKLLYHAHCHQKALVGTEDARHLIDRIWGGNGSLIPAGCCGMAGSFGHEVEHYDIARMIGELRLLPAVRARDGAEIAVSGFSCAQQISHHTDARPRHLIECIADLLARA